MNQESLLTRRLAAAQEAHARTRELAAVEHASTRTVVYRLYTERVSNLEMLVLRYFEGATLTPAVGMYGRTREHAIVIDIVGTLADLQSVAFLAGDIKQLNSQSSVLITWTDVHRLDV